MSKTTKPPEPLHCRLCGHKWTPKKKGKPPLSCPRCKRYDWNKQ